MTQEEKVIEIPFGAKDSELLEWVYYIPEGMEAEIKDRKVIIKKAESEDEKIRKEIINYILYKADGVSEEQEHSWIAYLEKQKDIEDRWIEDRGQCFWNGVEEGKMLAEKQKEQKPEWSEEDENARQNLIAHFEGKVLRLSDEAKKEAVAWLKSLRPQPKQEWNEEDEEHRQWILECLADGKRKVPEFAEQYQVAFDWLKSLRPHWKPTEEQMKALEDAFRKDGSDKYRKTINSLYQNLKKL